MNHPMRNFQFFLLKSGVFLDSILRKVVSMSDQYTDFFILTGVVNVDLTYYWNGLQLFRFDIPFIQDIFVCVLGT